jgi:isoquinoline 1-oxidoreductase alpha subunit
MTVKLTVNGKPRTFTGDPDMPLLWYLREDLGLAGAKYGCGIGSCGACTVHVDDAAVRSCSFPMSGADGVRVTTIEGLAGKGGGLHPVQQAWIDEDVPQCGYCQTGQIMAVVDFLKTNPKPSDDDLDAGLTNLCRCGAYTRIRAAIYHAAGQIKAEG